MFDSGVILWGEIRCQSLLGVLERARKSPQTPFNPSIIILIISILKLTGDQYDLVGSQRCNLFTNRTIF